MSVQMIALAVLVLIRSTRYCWNVYQWHVILIWSHLRNYTGNSKLRLCKFTVLIMR
jgi:hypothetical protein